mmetsp:Transcript_65672/g.188953  ORF Transcript_65672/g.188953 Transcript_65672/m.188953 type:complete len:209 (-) Transcript_65672:10-636(-)
MECYDTCHLRAVHRRLPRRGLHRLGLLQLVHAAGASARQPLPDRGPLAVPVFARRHHVFPVGLPHDRPHQEVVTRLHRDRALLEDGQRLRGGPRGGRGLGDVPALRALPRRGGAGRPIAHPQDAARGQLRPQDARREAAGTAGTRGGEAGRTILGEARGAVHLAGRGRGCERLLHKFQQLVRAVPDCLARLSPGTLRRAERPHLGGRP